ncbi:putative glycolipid-binding domain-containing protein [Dyadobacter psychrophilus]
MKCQPQLNGNDFEADIRVDDDGLVVDYPGLFLRVV